MATAPKQRKGKQSKKDHQKNKKQNADLPEGATGRDEGATGCDEGADKKRKGKYEVFWGSESPFSQFHACRFTVDDVNYCCMEQYMHHQKAVVFKDAVQAKAIMATEDPKKHKGCGRKVQNFDKDVWKVKSKAVVKKGNIHKYKQNPDLKKALMSTAPRTLVEASPRDRIWGIGLGPKNPDAHNPNKWRGSNLLGYILTEVRDTLAKEGDESKGNTDGMNEQLPQKGDNGEPDSVKKTEETSAASKDSVDPEPGSEKET